MTEKIRSMKNWYFSHLSVFFLCLVFIFYCAGIVMMLVASCRQAEVAAGYELFHMQRFLAYSFIGIAVFALIQFINMSFERINPVRLSAANLPACV